MVMKAVIIGGTTGLGLGISNELQKRNITDLITVGRNHFSFDNVNFSHTHFVSDVFQLDNFKKTLEKIASNHHIDLVMCVAGYVEPKKVNEFKYEDYEKHLKGNFLYVTDVFSILKNSMAEGSSFITIGSKWSFVDIAGPVTPYSVSKNALRGYTVSMAGYFPELKINHYAVPTMPTKLLKNAEEKLILAGEIKEKFSDSLDSLCHPDEVAVCLLNHVFSNKESGKTFYINRKLEVLDIVNNSNNMVLDEFNEGK